MRLTGSRARLQAFLPEVGSVGKFEYILGTENMSWAEHEAAAARWGGHIVSIADAAEYAFVRKLFSGDQWLGAIRLRQDNGPGAEHWRWSDGSPWVWHKSRRALALTVTTQLRRCRKRSNYGC